MSLCFGLLESVTFCRSTFLLASLNLLFFVTNFFIRGNNVRSNQSGAIGTAENERRAGLFTAIPGLLDPVFQIPASCVPSSGELLTRFFRLSRFFCPPSLGLVCALRNIVGNPARTCEHERCREPPRYDPHTNPRSLATLPALATFHGEAFNKGAARRQMIDNLIDVPFAPPHYRVLGSPTPIIV